MKTIVIGAGPAGLAMAACLTQAKQDVLLLERAQNITPAWRNHYDRLHLHTARHQSALPYMKMPPGPGTFPSRQEVVDYFESYAQRFGLAPRYGCEVGEIQPEGRKWRVSHSLGHDLADNVVLATGINAHPVQPEWDGLANFSGTTLHSSSYRNPSPFSGQRVLVVGIGNSGADITLDLAEAGIDVSVAVRGAVNILPATVFGIPITSMRLVRRLLGPKLADIVSAPLLRALIGRPSDYGFATPDIGPIEQIAKRKRIPLIDVGVLGAIKAGQATVRPGVQRVEGSSVIFADNTQESFDAIIFATGYRQDLRALLPKNPDLLDATGSPLISGAPSGAAGLFFCSYHVAPNGQLSQIAEEARAIAGIIAKT